MTTETELRLQGMRVLIDALGLIETERFLAAINREKFDYTEWRKQGLPDLSIDEGSIWIPVSSPHEATSPSKNRATTTFITTTYNRFTWDADPLSRQTVLSSPEPILSHSNNPPWPASRSPA